MHWLLWLIPLAILGPIMSIYYVITPIEHRIGGWVRELAALFAGIGVYFCSWYTMATWSGHITLGSIVCGCCVSVLLFPFVVYGAQLLLLLRRAQVVHHH